MSHLLAWTEIKITVALGPLDLCTVVGETEAHRMDTCKATAPRKDRSKAGILLYNAGSNLTQRD